MGLTVFDYVVLCLIGFSVLMGVMRGFLREVLALAGWVAAFVVARMYTAQVEPLLPLQIPGEAMRYLVGFSLLFLTTLLVSTLLAIALSQLVKQIGLGWLDRILGMLFGLLRGVLIVLIVVMLAGMTSLPKDERWQTAVLSAPLEAVVVWILPWMPQSLSKHVEFS